MRYISILLILSAFLNSCEHEYSQVKLVSPDLLAWNPLKPGDTLIFTNSKDDSNVYISTSLRHEFIIKGYGVCDECADYYSAPSERYSIESISKTDPNNKILVIMERDQYLSSDYVDYQSIQIVFQDKNEENEIKIYFSLRMDIINEHREVWGHMFFDTANVNGKEYYNVFTPKKINISYADLFYTKEEGIIGYKVDTVLWVRVN